MGRELIKGNEAVAEAAVRAGLQAYFGYPITPQTELLEYLSRRMPELGRAFVQAESELGAINMVYGAACTGARTMTSSSSPGISLMMEGLSYIAGTEVPMVLVDVMRGGPGLGNIAPSQADYNQIVHGGGHGDYHPIVLAPASVQESVDLTVLAFDLAEKYRSIAVVLTDGGLGQMMEPAELPEMMPVRKTTPDWAVSGTPGRERRILSSINLDPPAQERLNFHLQRRWMEIEKHEIRYKEYFMDGARIAVIGFGSAGRVALSAVRTARAQGIPVGLLRPISLNPFPSEAIRDLSRQVDAILVTEMNMGQMLEDVIMHTAGGAPVSFYGRTGGVVPFPEEILAEIQTLAKTKPDLSRHPRERWLERMVKVY
ncbi:MAG TPA: 3-methyl-2-oxobutanoate dehydrogenase subunit VorB [Anaerolineaceae bacterium]